MNWYQRSRLFNRKNPIATIRRGRFLILTTSHTGKMNEKNLGSEMKLPM